MKEEKGKEEERGVKKMEKEHEGKEGKKRKLRGMNLARKIK